MFGIFLKKSLMFLNNVEMLYSYFNKLLVAIPSIAKLCIQLEIKMKNQNIRKDCFYNKGCLMLSAEANIKIVL